MLHSHRLIARVPSAGPGKQGQALDAEQAAPCEQQQAGLLPQLQRSSSSISEGAVSSHTVEAEQAMHMSDLAVAALADLEGFAEAEEEGWEEDEA